MNYRGSYRHLLGNAKSAILAAIEIYNKPRFAYRDECFAILLLNAWELLLKAVLSRKGKSVFYPKERKKPYRTLSWDDAFTQAQTFFPQDLHPLPVRRNLDLLSTYRNNAVHFYNAQGFGSLVYALGQTSVVSFREILEKVFDVSLADEISWQLLPIGLAPPIDPIEYITKNTGAARRGGAAVRQFLATLAAATNEVEDAKADTGRLLTVFTVKLESTKKIERADVLVGVKPAAGEQGPLIITKTMDPNITHPLRQKEVIEKVGDLHSMPLTPHRFQAIAWKFELKTKPQFCWKATEGVLTKYSNDVLHFLKGLTKDQIEAAVAEYRDHMKSRARKKKEAA